MKFRELEPGDHPKLVVIEAGEECMESLVAFATNHRVPGGSFQGIGAFESATVAYWNWDTKTYEKIEVNEQVEVLSLVGNIARKDGQPRIHAHVVLSKRDGSCLGGHLVRGVVRPAVEIFVRSFATPLHRAEDADTKLVLLKIV